MKKWITLIGFLAFLIILFFVVRQFELDNVIADIKLWVADKGIYGPIVYAIAYAVATVLFIPGSALTVAAGAIFGSVTGVITVLVGANIGAGLSFLVSRYIARDAMTSLFSKNDKLTKLDDLSEKHGDMIVAITRLVPIFPFNFLNYAFGLTKISFKTYMMWTALCIAPGTVLYVVGTDAVTVAISEGRVPWSLIVIVLLILAILTFVVKKAKNKLQE